MRPLDESLRALAEADRARRRWAQRYNDAPDSDKPAIFEEWHAVWTAYEQAVADLTDYALTLTE